MISAFVGRVHELERLDKVFEQVRAGIPHLVLVDGAAGIGKTTLVRRFLSGRPELPVLHASGDENETDLPYGVLSQLTGNPHPADRDPIAAGIEFLERLGTLQDGGPVAVIVDDIHWADLPSLQAITFALRRLRADQVLSVVVAREPAATDMPTGLRKLLEDDRTARIHLSGLPAAELREFRRSVDGLVLGSAAADRLWAFTAGNPLHVRELLEHLPAGVFDDLTRPLPAPHGYASLVLARMAACGPATRDFLAAASVLTLPSPIDGIARLAAVEPLTALDEAVSAGLLEEQQAGYGLQVSFPHPLTQAAIYQGVGVATRHRLHARAAELALSDGERFHHRVRAATGPDPELAAELAAFARDEQRGGLWSAAGTHLLQAAHLAGDEAHRAQLLGEAIGALAHAGRMQEAATLAQRLPAGCPADVRAFAHGVLAQIQGRSDEAVPHLTEAWNRADRAAGPLMAARAAEQLALLTVMEGHTAQSILWAERALSIAGNDLDMGIVRGIRLPAMFFLHGPGKALDGVAHLPTAAAGTRRDHDQLVGRGAVRTWSGDLRGAIADLTGLLACSERLSAFQRINAHAHLGNALHLTGNWDEAIVHGEISVTLTEEFDQRWMAGGVLALAALVPAKRGDRATAEQHLSEGRRLEKIAANRLYQGVAEAWLATSQGDPARVLRVLHPLLDLTDRGGVDEPGVMDWRDLLSDAHLAVGEPDCAQAVLAPFERRALERARDVSLVRVFRAKGNLLAAGEDLTGAAEAFERGLRHAARAGVPFDRARLELDFGCFLRRRGSRSAAAARLTAAHHVFAALGATPFLERCDRELAACGLAPRRGPRSGDLTARELAVARLVATGRSNQQVGRELLVSVKTVEYHLGHVFTKLGVTNRAELAARFAPGGDP
ncbi:AAA family ATPase [Nonomuraea sp. NPDC047897]|uniref:helix-turn-helix transcriptional regulator n=1 Tax=Nonomuraea sp. NPDC047897 TaxID=3364346 RepID=UPI003718A512